MPSNYSELIDHLVATERLKTDRLIASFQAVDRAHFVRPEDRDSAYHDMPLSIGSGQTISQPTTVAIMLEALAVKPGDSVLDIGSGSGWTTALLGCLVGSHGHVLGLEREPDLVSFGQQNCGFYTHFPIRIEQASDTIGVPKQTFHRILVSAAATVLPKPLLEQVAIGGCLVIPVNHDIHVIRRVDVDTYHTDMRHGFRFVPLILTNGLSSDSSSS